MNKKGGYILHLDGTSEGSSPHLINALDEISSFVLDHIKIPTENAEQIIPMLYDIKKTFGNLLAIVHDMGKAVLSSTALVEDIDPNICYVLIEWGLDGKKQGDGFGFPFDRPHLVFYQRLITVHDFLDKIKHKYEHVCPTMLKDTPLVKNLENPEYVKILLNGKTTLDERFAEVDARLVRERLKQERIYNEKIPAKIKKIIRTPKSMNLLFNVV